MHGRLVGIEAEKHHTVVHLLLVLAGGRELTCKARLRSIVGDRLEGLRLPHLGLGALESLGGLSALYVIVEKPLAIGPGGGAIATTYTLP